MGTKEPNDIWVLCSDRYPTKDGRYFCGINPQEPQTITAIYIKELGGFIEGNGAGVRVLSGIYIWADIPFLKPVILGVV